MSTDPNVLSAIMSKFLKLPCAMVGLCGAVVCAAAPVALVEDVRGKVAGVEFMDYVDAGKVIKLGPRDSIVLGYLNSCWRETIAGGTVTVGEEQSAVQDGKVVRSKVPCDTRRMQLSAREATQSAATVVRGLRPDAHAATPPPVTLYGCSPVVEVNQSRGMLVIERVDQLGERYEVGVAGKALLRGRFLDLAKVGVALTPGAHYFANLGSLEAEFVIASDAKAGPGPIVGRLLRFP
jgi:hypothetical protein